MLAYDGSAKAHEGLYVATYAGGRWGTPLVVASGASLVVPVDEARKLAFSMSSMSPPSFLR